MTPILSRIQTVPDAHYIAVGKVVSNWAAFELIVGSALWDLGKIDDAIGACLTAQIAGSARLLDAFVAMVRFRFNGSNEAIIRKINKFSETTRELGIKRNRVVHDPWVAEYGTGNLHRFEVSAQKRLVFDYRPSSTVEVVKIGDEIADHIDRFDEIMQSVRGALDSFPKTPL